MSRRAKKKSSRSAARVTATSLTARAVAPYVAGVAVAFCAFIALDRWLLHAEVLTPFEGRVPLSPLYAFWMPHWRPAGVLFVLLALAAAAFVPRLLDRRLSEGWFGATLLVLALALPLALFLVRENLDRLGTQFLIYPQEEYFDDARRIVDLPAFIDRYAELAPHLSLHGRVHPPGFASFLFLTGRVAGPSPLAAGLAILVVFAGGVLLAWRAFAVVLDRREARIAAVLLLAVPSLIDFACTSMDAVFFTTACLVLLPAFTSLSARGRWWHAAATGFALYAAMFCSFSAAPLALFVGAYGAAVWWHRRSAHVPMQLAIVLGSFLVAYAAFRLAAGFDLWESFEVARQQHYEIMTTVVGRRVEGLYVRITFGNIAALLIGTGLAIVPLLVRRGAARSSAGDRRSLVLAMIVTLVAVCAGGVYTMETERILMFVMPWLALSAASAEGTTDSAIRLMVSAGWSQAFLMEALLFTLW